MARRVRIIVSIVVASVFMLAAVVGSASAATYEALAGMKSIKAIFDVRAGNTKSAVMQLKLIHDTYKDKSIRAVSKKPSFIVAFMGPAVKLISKDKQGISPEDQKAMDEIALTVQAMAKDGIKLEVCDFAVKAFGVDPASILPEIKHVPNGWISLIGYQAKGYSLVPAY
jgi:intracellular sulfur oxidation DsrE/DsrF family protein